jgi:hypothetical protein
MSVGQLMTELEEQLHASDNRLEWAVTLLDLALDVLWADREAERSDQLTQRSLFDTEES